MAVSYGYHHDGRFIEDIHPPGGGDGFDVRQPHVRRQAIGALDERYLRFRNIFTHTSATDTGISIPVRVRFGYTRVPPLATIDLPLGFLQRSSIFLTRATFYMWLGQMELRHTLKRAGQSMRRTFVTEFAGATASVASIGQKIHLPGRPWLPKKYSVAHGLYTHWNQRVSAWLKWAILPLALVLGLVLFWIMPLHHGTNPQPEGTPSTQKQHGQAATPHTTSPARPKPKAAPASPAPTPTGSAPSPSAAAGTGTTTTPIDPPATTPSAGGDPPSNTSSVPTVSGSQSTTSGSGGSSSTGGSSSSSSGLIPTTTVTVPPTTATIGGKQLAGTSGTNLTLN